MGLFSRNRNSGEVAGNSPTFDSFREKLASWEKSTHDPSEKVVLSVFKKMADSTANFLQKLQTSHGISASESDQKKEFLLKVAGRCYENSALAIALGIQTGLWLPQEAALLVSQSPYAMDFGHGRQFTQHTYGVVRLPNGSLRAFSPANLTRLPKNKQEVVHILSGSNPQELAKKINEYNNGLFPDEKSFQELWTHRNTQPAPRYRNVQIPKDFLNTNSHLTLPVLVLNRDKGHASAQAHKNIMSCTLSV